MRIAFFGSSPFSCHVLKQVLASEHEVAMVVTQPDHPAGRRMQLRPTALAELAAELGCRLSKPEKLRGNDELKDELSRLRVDALAVASYGKIIPRSLLRLTQWPLNVHPSPLPLLRGPSPLRSALLEAWAETQVCIMRMTPRIDDGPVMLRRGLAIAQDWNHADLEASAGNLGGELLARAMTLLQAGEASWEEQSHADATMTRVHSREDTWLDWEQSATALVSFVRAWDPDLGACTSYCAGGAVRRLKVWRAQAARSVGKAGAAPGSILEASRHELLVQCGAGALRLLDVQPESRARMAIASFLAGGQVRPGDRLGEFRTV